MLEHINKSMFVMGGGINYLLSNNSDNYINITTKGKFLRLISL